MGSPGMAPWWLVFAGAAAAAPDIALVLVDDGGFADMPGMPGSRLSAAEMPRLARAVAEGLLFTDAHSAASTCTPSRAALLTGREPRRTKVQGVLRPSGCGGLALTDHSHSRRLRVVVVARATRQPCMGGHTVSVSPQLSAHYAAVTAAWLS